MISAPLRDSPGPANRVSWGRRDRMRSNLIPGGDRLLLVTHQKECRAQATEILAMAAASGGLPDRRPAPRHDRGPSSTASSSTCRPASSTWPKSLAEKAGVPSIQDYCGLLLMRAIENERVRQKVADFELGGARSRDSTRSPTIRTISPSGTAVGRESRAAGQRRATDAPIFIEPQPAVRTAC